MGDKFLIIGDGVAGATAAEKIREEDEEADVKVFTDEEEPLYNRIMLKTFMKGSLPVQYTKMHDENWYDKRDIDLYLDTRIEDVDTDDNRVLTSDGEEYVFDSLLVASGGSPRSLPFVDDENPDNLYYMWTLKDAEEIKSSAEEAEKAVVIGGGLLGIDLAVAYAENDADVDYLIRGDSWWSRGLDTEGAGLIHERLEELGVNVITGVEAESLDIDSGNVSCVDCSDGESRECDVVSVAIGQTPNSDIIDVEKNESGMIKTDKYLETSSEGVFAAGNMVEYQSPVFERRTVNGSWDHSEAMGERAGLNMVRENEGNEMDVFDFVNTYGVGHFDVQFLAIGDWTGEPISRKYNDEEYRRLFFDEDRLVGAVLIGFTKGQEKLKQLIHDKKKFEDRELLLDKSFWE